MPSQDLLPRQIHSHFNSTDLYLNTCFWHSLVEYATCIQGVISNVTRDYK